MTAEFSTLAGLIRRLCEALAARRGRGYDRRAARKRRRMAATADAQARAGTRGDVPLVAAVVGGTNIGKSAVFNQLAGDNASAVSPLAAGTKHPVCLGPSERGG